MNMQKKVGTMRNNKIGLIGVHPEADKVWYEYYSWMPKHYTSGHHTLLKEFVNATVRN